MLKPAKLYIKEIKSGPAAFRRLCVETSGMPKNVPTMPPAAFRRLCVETSAAPMSWKTFAQPPLGGCVLKP